MHYWSGKSDERFRPTAAQPLPKPERPLPPIRLHDLRHLHATLPLLEGVPVHVVANRLGHSDPPVTLRVHVHVLRELRCGRRGHLRPRRVHEGR